MLYSDSLLAAVILLFWVYRQAMLGKMAIGAKIVDAETGDSVLNLQRHVAFCDTG